jgi:hypothetical protein
MLEQRKLLLAAATLANEWNQLSAARVRFIVRTAVTRVVVHLDRMCISVAIGPLMDTILGRADLQTQSATGDQQSEHVLTIPASLRRAGQEMRLVVEGDARGSEVNPVLAKIVHLSLQLRDQLLTGQDVGIAELAASAGVSGSHFTRVLRLGFLAPDILDAIANGRQPVGLTATKLLHDTRLPLDWSEQRKVLGFKASA